MSSSTEARVLRGTDSAEAAGLAMPEFRSGQWTRWGNGAVRGDDVTEQLLDRLAESTRHTARAQGYSVGWAAGRREAEALTQAALAETSARAAAEEERRATEHADAMAALRAAASQLLESVEEVRHAADTQAVELALELTRELVGQAAPGAGEHTVERILALLPDHPAVRVHLHPAVAASAGALQDRGVVVVADALLGPADALVETEDYVVDLRVETALARLSEVLA